MVEQEIVLVPVRPGRLFLPTVHTHLLQAPSGSRNRRLSVVAVSGEEGEPSAIVCETFVENAAEVVHVLPAMKTRTVLVPIAPRESYDV